uniref:DCD domain-containing protein n=1 Tax=Physcomitrium patens TaxID=3218 RepID=A0A7I4CRB1_PHYPA
MVGSTNRYHRQGPVAAHQVDLTHMKERKGRALDGGVAVNAGGPAAVGLNEPLGGFIFMCNNETMPEDLERQLFGLTQRYQDSVRAITPGLPLFLYNYSTKYLHGVYEATSDGGLNIDPEAWENKETKKGGGPVSRYPAQVRVRLREERPPLEEAKFRPLLHHYDGPKFRLELTVSEAEDLLKIFGSSSSQKMDKAQDDFGGEWERVKFKNKGSGTRVHRPNPTKRSSSPNSSSGRRRLGPPVNGSSISSNVSHTTAHYSSNSDFGRSRETRADAAQRWRSDSDSWSGSSSAGISTSSWASHDEDRPKKGMKENVVMCGEANDVVRADFVGDGSKLGSGKHIEAVGSRRPSANSENFGSGTQPVLGSYNGCDPVWQEREDGKFLRSDGETKKAENRSVWNDNKLSLAVTMAAPDRGNRAYNIDSGSIGGRMIEGSNLLGKGHSVDASTKGKESLADGTLLEDNERTGKGNSSSQGKPSFKDNVGKKSVTSENGCKKTPWQGNDAIVLRRLIDPGSSSNIGTPVPVVSSGQHTQTHPDISARLPDSVIKTSSLPQEASQIAGLVSMVFSDVEQGTLQSEQSPGMSSSISTKAQVQGPIPLPTRASNDFRRVQQYNLLKDRDFRRTQSPSPDQVPTMIPQRQPGQNLIPVRISTPPLQSSQQQYHPTQSPDLNGNFSDRRNGSDVYHGPTYRPIPSGLRDGEHGLQNGFQGGWGVPTPAISMIPHGYRLGLNGMFPLPSQQFLTNVEELHSEILEFAHTASPSAEARSCAEAAIDCVRGAVKKLWPNADVEVFGSYATGLCLSHSDVDVVVVDAPPPLKLPDTTGLTGTRLVASLLAPSIRLLGAALQDYDWCKSIRTIDSATMPVIKLQCRPLVTSLDPAAPVVKIDITIGGKKTNEEAVATASQSSEGSETSRHVDSQFELARKFHNGAAAREYVIKRLQQQPALAPLVLLLKSYLQSKGLKDVYTGGLGSFSLTIMLVFYLERVPISCVTSQEVRAQSLAPSNALVSSTSSPDITNLTSAPPGIDFLGSCEEESSCSTTTTDSVSVSNRASASCSTSEGSLVNGATAAGHIQLTGDVSKSGRCNQWTGGIIEQLLASMHYVASPNLGTLLIGFLQIFGWAIDFTQVRLVTKGNGGSGGLFYHDKTSSPAPLTIDDPLRPGANIGAGSFNMHQVQGAMQEMFHILIRPLPAASSNRVGTLSGRRRSLPLLDQLFTSGTTSLPPL